MLSRAGRFAGEMLDDELQPPDAEVFVHLQAIGHLRASAGQVHLPIQAVAECDCIESFATGKRSHAQLEMPLADDPGVDQLKGTIKGGLGECLSPRTCGAQFHRGHESELVRREFTIGLYDSLCCRVQPAIHLARKSLSELLELSVPKSHSSGHGVTAEPIQQSRMTCRHRVEHI